MPVHNNTESLTDEQLDAASLARRHLMLDTPIPKLVASLAVPSIISQIISVIYNTADTYFVAQIHTSAAAAVGVVFALMSIIHAFGFSIGMGANSIISRKLGAKQNTEAYIVANSALLSAFLFGTIIMILGEIFLNPLMVLLGSTQTILPFSTAYAKYILLGAPVMCPTFVLNNILRSEGKNASAMWGTSSGAILNLLLDPLFIFTFNWGIAGAAIATAVSQAISFLVLLSFFLRGKSIVLLHPKWIRITPSLHWQILTTGFPTVCRQGMGSISSMILNILAAGYGDAAVAAITISNKIYILVRHLILGIGQGMQSMVGYNYGAKCYQRVRQAFIFCTIIGTIIGLVAVFIAWPFADSIIRWFRSDEAVVAIGENALYFSCATMPLMAYSTYTNQLCQVLGFRLEAALLASCRQGFFFLPAAFILVRFFGIHGLEATQPVADLCTFLVSLAYQPWFFKKHLPIKEEQTTL